MTNGDGSRPIRVLHVCTYEMEGGAARAAHRLHTALRARGVDSAMLVQKKQSDDPTVMGPTNGRRKLAALIRPQADRVVLRTYRRREGVLFSTGLRRARDLVERINAHGADVVHLNWVSDGALGNLDIPRITAPIVWTLHDMWTYTGGCHYTMGCERWLEGCGSCPILGSHRRHDVTARIFREKARAFGEKRDITVIGPSRWMADCARRSPLLGRFPVHNIPYAIDLSRYAPYDQGVARDLTGLPRGARLILFGAMSATSDRRKGFQELIEALRDLQDLHDTTELVVFGASAAPPGADTGFRAHYLGHVHDHVTQRLLYSAADVMVVPSLQENLANTVIEALACGTPVVGFPIGGNPDMIQTGVNGAIAPEVSAEGLATAIRAVLEHPDPATLRAAARAGAERMFDPLSVTDRVTAVYREAIDRSRQ